MSLFNNMLGSEESLFKNELALDYSFIPKILPHREQQQRQAAACIQPLLVGKNGRNMFIYGAPGIGKTVAIRHVLNELEDETDEIYTLYVNCWQKNTTFKIITDLCEQLGYNLTHNKRTEELFAILKNMLNKKAAVFVFDEVDKLEDYDFLYSILEEIYKKSILLITNYQNFLPNLDIRLKSRLMCESMEFKPYSKAETADILKQRSQYAFNTGVWEDPAFAVVAQKAHDFKDIRTGLHLMRESGNIAESAASRSITEQHVVQALEKISEQFTIKDDQQLGDAEQTILDIVKNHSGKKIGDLFEIYKENGGSLVYKSFQRKIDHLSKNKFVSTKKSGGGAQGNTTIVTYSTVPKKLTDFE